MKRYAIVEKAKDADVIGILVGTLGVGWSFFSLSKPNRMLTDSSASYLPLISTLKALIASKEKKSYTVAVGKLNPAKLANFLEVDCFVLVACEENTLIDSKVSWNPTSLYSNLFLLMTRQEFLRPIITPFELELALTAKTWTGEYILDFGTLLNGKSFGQDFVDSDLSEGDGSDSDRPVYSSTTGKYRHPKKFVVRGIKGSLILIFILEQEADDS